MRDKTSALLKLILNWYTFDHFWHGIPHLFVHHGIQERIYTGISISWKGKFELRVFDDNLLLPIQVAISCKWLSSKNFPIFALKGVPANMIAKGNQQIKKEATTTPTRTVILNRRFLQQCKYLMNSPSL